MADLTDYESALKRGQRAFRQCSASGRYPYLPVLDDFLSAERLAQQVDLGRMRIPMDRIVGTRSKGRTTAFAANFMPLMPAGTEFAMKWERLCAAHLDEGIRDPIRAYEYLNRYYVEEGNKRVSVLRYFDAPAVYAHVIRVMPERLEDHPLYEEYLDFYAISRVNYLEFSRPGGYLRIQELMGREPGEPWTDMERETFSAAYHAFRRAYEAKGGAELAITVGDALLAYMEVFGYPSIRTKGEATLKRELAKMWEEITLLQEQEPVEVRLDPDDTAEGGLLSKIPKAVPKRLKVAFVHDENPDLSGWTYGHELGREHVQRVFGKAIDTRSYFDALNEDPLEVIEGAIDEGNTVIFTTSPRLQPASLKAAVAHPKCIILNCALNSPHRYIRTYYARMYEAKFVAGLIAGALAGTDDVGYVCDYPIYGQVAGINAFALGVQANNPFVRVHLEWSSVGGLEAAERRLTDSGVWIVSDQDTARLRNRDCGPFGLTIITDGGSVNLAEPMWLWGTYYERILRQIRDRTIQSQYSGSHRAQSYYWGMSAGVIGMRYSDEVPPATRKMAELAARSIRERICRPFTGPLITQTGERIIDSGEMLSADQVIQMSWLNENVVGSLPAWEDLDEMARYTVGASGVLMG